jgi:hypothetical protein
MSFAKNFNGLSVPEPLAKLLEFQEEVDDVYSDGFWLDTFDKDGLRARSKDKEFLSSLHEFAQADGTGSTYAFWTRHETDLSRAPVVALGSEGGNFIVAENIYKLLQIISFDAEPMIDAGGISFYKDEEDHEPSDEIKAYTKWLSKNYKLSPVKDPEVLVEKAQNKYEEEFREWLGRFIEEDESEEDDAKPAKVVSLKSLKADPALLLGAAIDSPDVRAYFSFIDAKTKVKNSDGMKYWSSKATGLEVQTKTYTSIIDVVTFKAEGHEGFKQYNGKLPYDLGFDMSVEDINRIIGKMGKDNGEGFSWEFDDFWLGRSENRKKGKIESYYVMTK